MRKLIGIPAGLLAALVPASAAQADTTLVGSSNQTSSQKSDTSQVGVQGSGGGLTVGGVTQSASNSNTPNVSSSQTVGGSSGTFFPPFAFFGSSTTIVGSPQQSSDQAVGSTQSINQGAGNGGTSVGPISQTAGNTFSPTLGSSQGMGGGFAVIGVLNTTIIGDPAQRNRQAITDSGSVTQAAGNAGTVVGSITQAGTTGVIATVGSTQSIGSGLLFCSLIIPPTPGFCVTDTTLVGNPTQLNSQVRNGGQAINQTAATAVLVGPLMQTQSASANVTISSTQTQAAAVK